MAIAGALYLVKLLCNRFFAFFDFYFSHHVNCFFQNLADEITLN